MPTDSGAAKNRVEFLAVAASIAATMALGAVAYEHQRVVSDVNALQGIVGGQSVSIASALEHNASHEADAEREIARIDRCEQAQRSLSQLPVQIEWLKKEVSDLKEDMRRTETHYQSAVIPMIQQSNQLQMQRIQQGMADG